MKQPPFYDEGDNPGNGWRSPDLDEQEFERNKLSFAGYHQFQDEEGEHGSFEVFFHRDTATRTTEDAMPCGWYWWACFPGCLPDGDPSGPFETAQAAYEDARRDE